MSDTSPRGARVTARAIDLWGRAGKPDAKDGYFWAQAEREISEEIQREAGGPFVALLLDPMPPGWPPLRELPQP